MIKQGVNKRQILDKINEFHIFKRYAPEFTIGKMFRGDIGRTESERYPSANIYFSPKGLRYTDFGVGTFDAFNYVMAKFNLSYEQCLEKIDIEFNLNIGYYNNNRTTSKKKYNYKKIKIPEATIKPRRIIRIKASKWSDLDLLYWQDNGWNQSMLDMAKIRPIEAYFINYGDGELIRYNVKMEFAYSYDYYIDDDGIFQRKIYIPKRTKGKWISNVNNQTTQGWDILPKFGNICFITSSYKDCGPMWQIYKKPVALAPNNEGSFITLNVLHKLRQRYKQLVILYDNDIPGIKNARKYSNKYNIPYIHSPVMDYKDPAELYQAVGVNRFYQLIKQELINKNIKHYL